jgi:hypothetical protein
MKEKKRSTVFIFTDLCIGNKQIHSFLQIYHGEKQKETDLFIKKNKESYKL